MAPINGDQGIRTIELSDPDLPCEGIQFVTMYSPALGGRGDLSIFAPHGIAAMTSVPVVLLLHGVYGSHWAWFFKGAAHRTAVELISAGRIRPMLLVSPSDGLYQDGSGYLAHSGHNYEAWITKDVLECIRTSFSYVDRNSSVFLAGLSMGGYGALRLGAKHPKIFHGVSAHSAITNISEMKSFAFEPFPIEQIDPADMDLLHWMERNRSILPPLRFDCGIDDPLLDGNRRLHTDLQKRRVPHQYFEFPGGHTWQYWRTHLASSLLFFETIVG